jgi:hypothetical protein
MRPNHEEFLAAWHVFRDIMCQADKTPDEKFDAWGDLLHIYFTCESEIVAVPDEEAKTRDTAMDMLMVEFPMRMGLEAAIKWQLAFDTGCIADAVGDTEAIDYMFGPDKAEGIW